MGLFVASGVRSPSSHGPLRMVSPPVGTSASPFFGAKQPSGRGLFLVGQPGSSVVNGAEPPLPRGRTVARTVTKGLPRASRHDVGYDAID